MNIPNLLVAGHFHSCRPHLLGYFVVSVCFALLAATLAFAQGTRGSIRGTVTDPNGAVVAGANVKLVDLAKQQEVRTVQTNESGEYQFLEIEPATYDIVITAPGFSETRLSAAKVEPNRNLQLDAKLAVGGATADVTVTATQELVDRETPTLGTTVDNRRVVGLPLNGRNVLDLALLQPGVTPAANNQDPNAAFGAGAGFRVNGSRGVENNLTLDGSNNNEVAIGGSVGVQPRPDAVQEFRLLTSNFEAEFGRNTGSVVNVVTKSGTNEYHGNARIFYRPTFLSAARFFDQNSPSDKPRRGTDDFRRPFERKEIGGQLGGPIKLPRFGEGGRSIYNGKNKAYFFIDYERRAQLIGSSKTITAIPTLDERNGIFTRVAPNAQMAPSPLLDPATGAPFPIISGTVAPGQTIRQQIPVGRFSPIAQFYLKSLPIPDANGEATVGANDILNNDYLTARVDYTVNQKQTLDFTFNFFNDNENQPFSFGGGETPGFGELDKQRTDNFVLRHTYTLSPKLVNSLLVGYARNNQPGVVPENTTTPAQIGFTANFVANQKFAGPPFIQLLDRNIVLGNSFQGPQARVSENIQLQDSVSYEVGNHRLKFGVDMTKYKQNQLFLFVNQGIFTFSSSFGGKTTGDDFADFLIGNTPIAEQFGANGARDFRQFAIAGFGQDSWRVSDSLTLSLGLRWEYNSPLTDKFNRVAYYRPGATSQLLMSGQLRTFEGVPITIPPGFSAPVGLVFPGDPDPVLGGKVPAGGVAKDLDNFAPRIGFAYSPRLSHGLLKRLFGGDRQTVLRGGFGIFYGAIIGDTELQQLSAPGFNGTNSFFFPGGGTLANPFGPDPFPNFGQPAPQIPNPFTANQFTIGVDHSSLANQLATALSQFSQPIDPRIETPYTYQYNLTLERGFHKNYVLGLSYVGNRGRRQYVPRAINPPLGTFFPGRPDDPPPTVNNLNARRLNRDIALSLSELTSDGNSWYNALEANLQRRYSNGLLFQVAYTFSKSMNDADNQRGSLAQGAGNIGSVDIIDRRFDRALSDDDVPHRFVASVIYDLPLARYLHFAPQRLSSGWSLGGIYTYQSGTPFTVLNPFDTTGTDGVNSYADLGAPFTPLDPRTHDTAAFNSNAFVAFGAPDPVTGAYTVIRRGTSGRNQFRAGNNVNNVDLILSKRTRLWSESTGLELRFEAFNALNHTQFTILNTNLLDTKNFGHYTDARESRVIQLGARFTF